MVPARGFGSAQQLSAILDHDGNDVRGAGKLRVHCAPYSTTENATEPTPKRHAMHQARHGRHAGHMRSVHRMRHAPLASRGSRAPNDNIANQLNSQELSRVSGSSAPAGRIRAAGLSAARSAAIGTTVLSELREAAWFSLL
jgi:hypothetical protein